MYDKCETTPEQILRNVFGHNAFRGPQRQIVEHLLNGKHALVIMPTGMGKSLCYQVPALCLAAQHKHLAAQHKQTNSAAAETSSEHSRPLSIVLSPLIALMKDQVDGLRERHVAATYINSSLRARERERRYSNIENG